MRNTFVLLLFTLSSALAIGQSAWWLWLPDSLGRSHMADVVELSNGEYLSIAHVNYIFEGDALLSRSWAIRSTAIGEINSVTPIQIGVDTSVVVPVLLSREPSDEFIAPAVVWDRSTTSGHALTYFQLDATGLIQNVEFHLIEEGSSKGYFQNAAYDHDESVVIAGALKSIDGFWANRLLLARKVLNGGTFDHVIYGPSQGYKVGRHAIPHNNGVLVSMEGSIPEGPWGMSTILTFDHDLSFDSGFPLTSVSGSGSTVQADSMLRDCLYMTVLSGDTLVISGRVGLLNDGFRAALTKYGPEGQLSGAFLPRGEFYADYVAAFQSHDLTPSGELVFAMHENLHMPPPYDLGTQPSRIHVYRLDTLLNVQCEYIVDGFADNAYYFLNRIKAASDGGVLLMGSRRELGTMGQPRGWLMKLPAEECMPLSVEEQAHHQRAEVFPNPGRTGFTLVLSGPAVHGARVDLFNAQGALVSSTRLDGSTAQVDTHALAAGLYTYRVQAQDGRMLATGRWVRE